MIVYIRLGNFLFKQQGEFRVETPNLVVAWEFSKPNFTGDVNLILIEVTPLAAAALSCERGRVARPLMALLHQLDQDGRDGKGWIRCFFWFEFWNDEKNLLYEYGKLRK